MKKLSFLIIAMQITLFAAPYIPINSGDVVEDHVDYLEKKYYELELGKTQTADIQLTDLDADIDLYVAINRRAAIRDNDCYSSNGDTTYEKCVLTSTAPEGKENSIIILVYGFKASNYKLKISTREGGESIKEISDTPLSGHLKQGESEQYKFLAKKGETYTTTLNMFNNATSFTNHDLSKWNVVKTEKYSNFLTNAGENNIEPLWILENQVDEIDEGYKK